MCGLFNLLFVLTCVFYFYFILTCLTCLVCIVCIIFMICICSVLLSWEADAEGVRPAACNRSALDQPGDSSFVFFAELLLVTGRAVY